MEAVDTAEDLEFLIRMIKELNAQADHSLNGFYCEKNTEYSQYERISKKTGLVVSVEPKYAQFHVITLTWRPSDVDHQTYKHIHCVRFNYTPYSGVMNLGFEYQDNNIGSNAGSSSNSGLQKSSQYKEFYADYKLGWNGIIEHKELKLAFYKLYKKVVHYQEVAHPKKMRDQMTQAVCEMFPTIMDDVLFGDSDEKAAATKN